MQYTLIIYVEKPYGVHQIYGPFFNEAEAFMHVDKIRKSLDDAFDVMGLRWLYSVWPLTNPEV